MQTTSGPLKATTPEKAQLPQGLLEYFGGVPTKEAYADYLKQLIKQEKEVLRGLKRSYSVFVDYEFVGRKLLAFHNSLNPRVTFGYSNSLHEECDFALDEEKREAFLNSSLAELPQFKDDTLHDWGVAAFDGVSLVYEDLTLSRGDEIILETISHEQIMTVRLNETDLAALASDKEGKKLVDKLRSAGKT